MSCAVSWDWVCPATSNFTADRRRRGPAAGHNQWRHEYECVALNVCHAGKLTKRCAPKENVAASMVNTHADLAAGGTAPCLARRAPARVGVCTTRKERSSRGHSKGHAAGGQHLLHCTSTRTTTGPYCAPSPLPNHSLLRQAWHDDRPRAPCIVTSPTAGASSWSACSPAPACRARHTPAGMRWLGLACMPHVASRRPPCRQLPLPSPPAPACQLPEQQRLPSRHAQPCSPPPPRGVPVLPCVLLA